MGLVYSHLNLRSKSIVVPFGRKKSWKSRDILRCETKAMKQLEREMKESVLKEREVWVEFSGWSL